jgi:hypothetical protein
MFGLTAYLDKLYEIKWFFNDEMLNDLQSLLFCEFEKLNNDYYKIKKISYTYIDLLLGLEELDFTFYKKNDEYIIHIK